MRLYCIGLKELDISEEGVAEELVPKESFPWYVVEALGALSWLKALNLSNRQVQKDHLIVLLLKVPNLRSLIIHNCPILPLEVILLERRFTQLFVDYKMSNGNIVRAHPLLTLTFPNVAWDGQRY